MADQNENLEFHRRHIIPNLKQGIKSGFKELSDGLKEGVEALLPFAALASDPLLAFGLGGIQKGFTGLFGEEGLFKKDERSQEQKQADELQENIKLREQEVAIQQLRHDEQQKIWDDLNQTLIDEGRTATADEQRAIDAAERNITSLETAIRDSREEIDKSDGLQAKLDDLVSVIESRGDTEEQMGRLQNLSGNKLIKEIENLQKQQKGLFSGSPPYLKTIAEYLEDFQWPMLEAISTSLGNQETLTKAIAEDDGPIQISQDPDSVTEDYFTGTQQPILESISKSFEGMHQLEIKKNRFSEEREREGEDQNKFGWLSNLFGKKKRKKEDF